VTSSGIALLMGLSTAFAILWLVRRDHIHGAHALGWLTLAFAIAVFVIFPSLSDRIANAFGVAYSPTLMLSGSVMVLFIKALASDIENAKIRIRHVRLTQRLALLEARMKKVTSHDSALEPKTTTEADESG